MKSQSQFQKLMGLGLSCLGLVCSSGQVAVASLPNDRNQVFDSSVELIKQSGSNLQNKSIQASGTKENPSAHQSKKSTITENILDDLLVEGLWVIQPDLPSNVCTCSTLTAIS